MKSSLVIMGAVVLASFCEAMHPNHDSEEDVRFEAASGQNSHDSHGRSLQTNQVYYTGSGQLVQPYIVQRPMRTKAVAGYASGYDKVVETEHMHMTSVSLREDRAVINRGKTFIRIIWDLITLLPKSAIRHGLFIPMKIAKFIYVVGKTILENIENTINSRISYWKDEVLGGVRENFINDFTSVRDVLQDLLAWVNRGFSLQTSSSVSVDVVPEVVYEPFVVKLRSLTRELPVKSP